MYNRYFTRKARILKTRGFTLIELLIVIGILAVLATITVLVLNPAQLFAQARDAGKAEVAIQGYIIDTSFYGR